MTSKTEAHPDSVNGRLASYLVTKMMRAEFKNRSALSRMCDEIAGMLRRQL